MFYSCNKIHFKKQKQFKIDKKIDAVLTTIENRLQFAVIKRSKCLIKIKRPKWILNVTKWILNSPTYYHNLWSTRNLITTKNFWWLLVTDDTILTSFSPDAFWKNLQKPKLHNVTCLIPFHADWYIFAQKRYFLNFKTWLAIDSVFGDIRSKILFIFSSNSFELYKIQFYRRNDIFWIMLWMT